MLCSDYTGNIFISDFIIGHLNILFRDYDEYSITLINEKILGVACLRGGVKLYNIENSICLNM